MSEVRLGLGQAMRKKRKMMDLGQREIAEQVGVSQQTIAKYERFSFVPDDKLEDIARVYGLNPKEYPLMDNATISHSNITADNVHAAGHNIKVQNSVTALRPEIQVLINAIEATDDPGKTALDLAFQILNKKK